MDCLLKILIGIRIICKGQKVYFSKIPIIIMNYKVKSTAVSWAQRKGGKREWGEGD